MNSFSDMICERLKREGGSFEMPAGGLGAFGALLMASALKGIGVAMPDRKCLDFCIPSEIFPGALFMASIVGAHLEEGENSLFISYWDSIKNVTSGTTLYKALETTRLVAAEELLSRIGASSIEVFCASLKPTSLFIAGQILGKDEFPIASKRYSRKKQPILTRPVIGG